jgi:hypothetical protein
MPTGLGRIVVLGGLIGAIAIPALLIFVVGKRMFFDRPSREAGPSFKEVVQRLEHAGGSPIVVGGNRRELQARLDALRAISAMEGEARGAVRNLQVVAVRTTGGRIAPASEAAADFRPLELNLRGSRDTATLLVGGAPLRARLVLDPQPRRGILGLESAALIEVASGAAGILAGFRIGPLSQVQAASAIDLQDFNDSRSRALCASIRRWTEFFSVATHEVRYVLLEDPTRIEVNDQGWKSDGTPVRRLSGPALWRACGA